MTHHAAQTILAQLGGNKFLAMTGAKNLVTQGNGRGLQFDLPRGAKNKSNRVVIQLTDADDYTIVFYRWDAKAVKLFPVEVVPFVTVDALRPAFTRKTGLEVAL